MEAATGTAAALIPSHPTLTRLRERARHCTPASLYRCATQTVFGEGPAHAALMLVGETAGDREASPRPGSSAGTPTSATW